MTVTQQADDQPARPLDKGWSLRLQVTRPASYTCPRKGLLVLTFGQALPLDVTGHYSRQPDGGEQ
jgi:hypothetical protein